MKRSTLTNVFTVGTAVVMLAACGGGDTPPDAAERIRYAEATPAGKGRVADYMNAEWLYENYFGHLGLPAEIKPRLMVEMRRLANGFAMQLGLGEDVAGNMAHFHSMMNGAMGQTMLQRFATRMNGDAPLNLAAGTQPDAIALAEQPASDAEARAHAARAAETDRIALHNLRQVALAVGMPYDLASDPTPYISWSAGFIAQKKGGGTSGGGSSNSGPTTSGHGTTNWPWIHGDIMYLGWNQVDNPNKDEFPLGHMAIVDKEGDRVVPRAIDAHPKNPNGTVFAHRDTEALAERYKLAQGHHLRIPYERKTYCDRPLWGQRTCWENWTGRSYLRVYAIDYARSLVGATGYSFTADKNTTEETYCSLLVWSAYMWASNKVSTTDHMDGYQDMFLKVYVQDKVTVNLDADGGFWVLPNDVLRSPWVQPAFRVSDSRPKASEVTPGDRDGAVDYGRSTTFYLPGRIDIVEAMQ